jgi:hypothetical protein
LHSDAQDALITGLPPKVDSLANAVDRLEDSHHKLADGLLAIDGKVTSLQKDLTSFVAKDDLRWDMLDDRLDLQRRRDTLQEHQLEDHARRINRHSDRTAELETKLSWAKRQAGPAGAGSVATAIVVAIWQNWPVIQVWLGSLVGS